MLFFHTIKYNLSKTYALAEKNVKLAFRFKLKVILSFISPIIGIFFPIIIMGQFFEYNDKIGPWTAENIYLYQFIAYQIMLLRTIINTIPANLATEKYWETLPAIIIAPCNRINLLFGSILGRIIMISIPFTFFIIMSYIIYPISFFTVLFILTLYFFLVLIFSGIGLVLGIFAVSNESIRSLLGFLLKFVFLFTCMTYPFEIFPGFIQELILLNPLYYIFDIIRYAWIENNLILTITTHSNYFFIVIIGAIISPIISVFIFNIIYKKYGIVGA